MHTSHQPLLTKRKGRPSLSLDYGDRERRRKAQMAEAAKRYRRNVKLKEQMQTPEFFDRQVSLTYAVTQRQISQRDLLLGDTVKDGQPDNDPGTDLSLGIRAPDLHLDKLPDYEPESNLLAEMLQETWHEEETGIASDSTAEIEEDSLDEASDQWDSDNSTNSLEMYRVQHDSVSDSESESSLHSVRGKRRQPPLIGPIHGKSMSSEMSKNSPLQAVLAHGATEHTKSYRTTSQSLSQTVCGPGEGSPASSLRSIQSYFKAPTFPSSTPVEVYPYESSGEEGSVYAKLKRGLVSREEQSSYPTSGDLGPRQLSTDFSLSQDSDDDSYPQCLSSTTKCAPCKSSTAKSQSQLVNTTSKSSASLISQHLQSASPKLKGKEKAERSDICLQKPHLSEQNYREVSMDNADFTSDFPRVRTTVETDSQISSFPFEKRSQESSYHPKVLEKETQPVSIPIRDTTPPDAPRLPFEDPLRMSIARKIVKNLIKFQGCGKEKHEERAIRHDETTYAEHYPLSAACGPEDFHNVLKSPTLLSDRYKKVYDRKSPIDLPDPSLFREIYEGGCVGSKKWKPKHICLHAEVKESAPKSAEVSFDFDSCLGFAHSLAFARRGFKLNPVPKATQNIKTDLHIQSTANYFGDDGEAHRRQLNLRDIPHSYLGRMTGDLAIEVYVLFPRLANCYREGKFTALTQHDQTRWLDRILLPAWSEITQANQSQHYPPTYATAMNSSKARQTECRKTDTGGYQATQALHYPIQSKDLAPVWDKVLELIEARGDCNDFRDLQIFFSGKNFKGELKSNCPLECIAEYKTKIAQQVDFDYVVLEDFCSDFGKETCSTDTKVPGQEWKNVSDPEPQTYLYKVCCLRKWLRFMFEGNGYKATFYNIAFLRDAVNMTVQANVKSRFRRSGLIWSQFYASFKESLDAAKTYPFDNEAIEGLAIDPGVRRAFASLAGVAPQNVEVLKTAYIHSKTRLYRAMRDWRDRSMGVREEHRITWPLLCAIEGELENREALEDPEAQKMRETGEPLSLNILNRYFESPPSHVWNPKTRSFTQFFSRHANKHAAGFELAHAACDKKGITKEQTLVMIMYLRALRFAVRGGAIYQEPALWVWKREIKDSENSVKNWYGMGMEKTMIRCGYGWFRTVIDPKRFTFKTQIDGAMLFGSRVLSNRYTTRREEIRQYESATQELDLCRGYLMRTHSDAGMHKKVIDRMIFLCLLQFRCDVGQVLAKHAHKEYQTRLQYGDVQMDYKNMRKALGTDLHLVQKNRASLRSFQDVWNRYWGPTDHKLRPNWEFKPYRVVFFQARSMMTQHYRHPGSRGRQIWDELFSNALRRYTWIFPSSPPSSSVFFLREKEKFKFWSLIGGGTNQERWGGSEVDRRKMENPPVWARWKAQIWERELQVLELTLRDSKTEVNE